MFEYIGAAHIHSIFSDGSGKVDEIAEIASEVGLDFILLTDHNTLRALDEGYEKFYNKTLLIAGCEINDKENQNHYLAFGIDKTPSTRLPAKEYVKLVKEKGGFGFLAHPHEKRSSMKEHPPYPWTEWDSEDFDGIEIWNHMSEWMEGLTEENKYNYFVHPLKSIDGPPAETIKVWDEINIKRKVVGLGGVDAHAHKLNLLGFFEVEVFPYKVLFKSVRTHVLCDKKIKISSKQKDVEYSKNLIYEALRNGRSFIANYYHADATGFRFFAEADNKIYQMGDTFNPHTKVKLRVLLPNATAEIKLIRNGKEYEVVNNIDADFNIDKPGAYRVEVYIDGKAWIFSNHIRIGI